MNTIVNFHVIDPKNIGDRLSSPLQYFDFPGFKTQALDIRNILSETIDSKPIDSKMISQIQNHLENSHIIIGGGGLAYDRFKAYFKAITHQKKSGKLIAWGIGQQSYNLENVNHLTSFDYNSYLNSFDLIGIRDYGQSLPWLPCVSCMHPSFDRPRDIKHDIVIFSHKKFQIDIPGVPRLNNATQNFEHILDFLGSGETILTSSYHGAYWGTLLGRKVLGFPFSTKFYTFKHLPTLYPVKKWKPESWKFSIFKKQLYQHWYKNKFLCDLQDWQALLKDCRSYPESLIECRSQNQQFYHQCLELLEKS